jgi:hypothetical protein
MLVTTTLILVTTTVMLVTTTVPCCNLNKILFRHCW